MINYSRDLKFVTDRPVIAGSGWSRARWLHYTADGKEFFCMGDNCRCNRILFRAIPDTVTLETPYGIMHIRLTDTTNPQTLPVLLTLGYRITALQYGSLHTDTDVEWIMRHLRACGRLPALHDPIEL